MKEMRSNDVGRQDSKKNLYTRKSFNRRDDFRCLYVQCNAVQCSAYMLLQIAIEYRAHFWVFLNLLLLYTHTSERAYASELIHYKISLHIIITTENDIHLYVLHILCDLPIWY